MNETWETAFLIYFQNTFSGSRVASVIPYIVRNLRKYSVNDQTQVTRIDKNYALFFPFFKRQTEPFVEMAGKLIETVDTFLMVPGGNKVYW